MNESLIDQIENDRSRARTIVKATDMALELSDVDVELIEVELGFEQEREELQEALSVLRLAGLLRY